MDLQVTLLLEICHMTDTQTLRSKQSSLSPSLANERRTASSERNGRLPGRTSISSDVSCLNSRFPTSQPFISDSITFGINQSDGIVSNIDGQKLGVQILDFSTKYEVDIAHYRR